MKLATYSNSGRSRLAVVDTERGELLDLVSAAGLLGRQASAFDSMQALIEGGHEALDRAQILVQAWPSTATVTLATAKLLAPLPCPPQMRDCLVFEEHLRNSRHGWATLSGHEPPPIPQAWYERPTWYKCNRFSVVGPDHDVAWPSYSNLMDFELELACVIGRGGVDIAPADAMGRVFGFTIFNDFSARDLQIIERPLGMGPMKSKDFDTGNVLGPWIVTLDEFPNPDSLKMEARVNGQRWGGGDSVAMQHKFSEIISFISQCETLYPGEIIASGTVGTGCGLELGKFLSPDDVVELEIEGIGVLRNRIVRAAREMKVAS